MEIITATNVIKNAISNNKLSHAYLFYGDKGVDVEKPIIDSIKLILNSYKVNYNDQIEDLKSLNYYDFKMISPSIDNKIKKESVDNTISQLLDTPLEKNGIKILYIKDIDLGNKSSLNSLLKFIEEPVENLIIFMSTNYFDSVISTIKSRAQNIYVKRELLMQKINNFSKLINKDYEEYLNILATIYSKNDDINNIDLVLFKNVYDELLDILDKSLKHKYLLKTEVSKIWTKQNNEFILNIFQYFYYQIVSDINKNYPLFPKKDNLIYKYKSKNIDYFFIQKLIDQTKRNIFLYGNFELQKMMFLNELEKLY